MAPQLTISTWNPLFCASVKGTPKLHSMEQSRMMTDGNGLVIFGAGLFKQESARNNNAVVLGECACTRHHGNGRVERVAALFLDV